MASFTKTPCVMLHVGYALGRIMIVRLNLLQWELDEFIFIERAGGGNRLLFRTKFVSVEVEQVNVVSEANEAGSRQV